MLRAVGHRAVPHSQIYWECVAPFAATGSSDCSVPLKIRLQVVFMLSSQLEEGGRQIFPILGKKKESLTVFILYSFLFG